MKRAIIDYFSDAFTDELEFDQTEFELDETEKHTDEDPECEIC